MINAKKNRPGRRAFGEQTSTGSVHSRKRNAHGVSTLSPDSVCQPPPINCPTCGTIRLFLVRREVFIKTTNDVARFVQDRTDPLRSRIYTDRDMRFGGGNAVIQHYVCGEAFALCPAFSIRLYDELYGLCGPELVYRRSAPELELHAHAIRQAHISADMTAQMESWRVMYDNAR